MPDSPQAPTTYPFVYRATVKSVQDPLKLGRVTLVVHHVFGKLVTDWAWPASMPVGGKADYGTFFAPDTGSTVWCMFENGDPQKPVYLGGWWGSPDGTEVPNLAHTPAEDESQSPTLKGLDTALVAWGRGVILQPGPKSEAKYPFNRVFRFPNNDLSVEMDDTSGKGRLAWHLAGNFDEIDKNGERSTRLLGKHFSLIEGGEEKHIKVRQETVVEGDMGRMASGSVYEQAGSLYGILAATVAIMALGVSGAGGGEATQAAHTGISVGDFKGFTLGKHESAHFGDHLEYNIGKKTEVVIGVKEEFVLGSKMTSVIGSYMRMAATTVEGGPVAFSLPPSAPIFFPSIPGPPVPGATPPPPVVPPPPPIP